MQYNVNNSSVDYNITLVFIKVSKLYDQSVNIVFSLCVFGFFALPLVPVCMELGVEITYPVGEATSSGLLWSSV